jgi:hypothetical protein
MNFQDVMRARYAPGIALVGFVAAVALIQISAWFLLVALSWVAWFGWCSWKLMRDAEVCIDDNGIVERGIFVSRRYVWADTSERPDAPTRRGPKQAVALGYRLVRGRYNRKFPVLVVCCAGDPYPRMLGCTRNGSLTTVVSTLVELADAGYPASALVPQSPKVWAADPRSGLDPRAGRFPRRLRHRFRFR